MRSSRPPARRAERPDDQIHLPTSANKGAYNETESFDCDCGRLCLADRGGFLGVGRHDVAIPVSQIKQQSDGKFILAGATKDALKAMPPFEYAN